MSRHKSTISSMMPQKKWLSKAEAMAYLDLSINVFEDVTATLTKSSLTGGKKIWFKVSELDSLFDKSIIQSNNQCCI